jgi:hypothetical protein
MALLVCDRWGRHDSSAEESIDDGTEVKQVFPRAHEWGIGPGTRGGVKVGPFRGNQGFTPVRQDENEIQLSLPLGAPENG